MIDLRNGGIVAAWHEFSAHAGECEVCGGVQGVVVSLLSGGEGKDAIRPHFAGACPTGEPLLWAWDVACQDAVQASGAAAKRLGVWKDGPGREERVQAILALPDGPYLRLLAMEPEERRLAAVEAITRAHQRTRVVVLPAQGLPARPNVCPECGKEVKPGGIGLHRAKAHRR